MLLHEFIMQRSRQDGADPAQMTEFGQAPIFKIDNVAAYFWQHPNDVWDLVEDFPNMAPPFPRWWMEYTSPSTFHLDGRYVKIPGNTQVGALISAYDPPAGATWQWSLMAMFYYRRGKLLWGGNLGAHLGIEADGSMAKGPDGKGIYQIMVPNDPTAAPRNLQEGLAQHIKPFMLAVSFLHCKNVVVVNQTTRPSKRQRARGEAPQTVRTLNLRPLKTILRQEGRSGEVGLRRAMHICRGHFRTYSEDAPLFGKTAGTFFIPAHVRGSGEAPPARKYNLDLGDSNDND